MTGVKDYDYNVFVNCPFDKLYKKLFYAIVFTIIDCGFKPKCALEVVDSSEERMKKLFELISRCRLGIHDISRTQLDSKTRLPRFNMPLELGMFFGAKNFGTRKQKLKNCIIMDSKEFRYQMFISDISGKDIKAHNNKVKKVIKIIRDWLGTYSEVLLHGQDKIYNKYNLFDSQLPEQCKILSTSKRELTFMDFRLLAEEWLVKYDDVNG